MKNEEFVPIIEAILFAAGFPVKYDRICEELNLSTEELNDILSSKAFEYKGRGIRLIRYSDSCQLSSNELYEKQVKATLGMRSGGALSNSALEVLAIVAYNQPVTKAFIEQVRGVDSSYAVTTLGEKSLIEVTGRLDVPGKPNLYGTTDTFLRCFGLASLDELPKNEVLGVISEATETSENDEQATEAKQAVSENQTSNAMPAEDKAETTARED